MVLIDASVNREQAGPGNDIIGLGTPGTDRSDQGMKVMSLSQKIDSQWGGLMDDVTKVRFQRLLVDRRTKTYKQGAKPGDYITGS